MSMEKYLLRLYPRTWRKRYEDELLAMLEQRPLSFKDGANLFFGALDAWLHPLCWLLRTSVQKIGMLCTIEQASLRNR